MKRLTIILLLIPLFCFAQNKASIIEEMLVLQENVFVHFNKTYFYPNETVHYSVNMLYADPAYGDSLSQVLYSDFISPDGAILKSFIYPIVENTSNGGFLLSDTLATGTYSLRFYTRWMQNYGDSVVQYYPINIVPYNKVPIGNASSFKSCDYIQIKDKNVDSVSIEINIPNLKTFSISLTDTSEYKELLYKYQPKIRSQFASNELFTVNFPIEKKQTISGKIFQGNKLLKNESLVAVNKYTKETIPIEINQLGDFSYSYEGFIDQNELLIGASKSKKQLFFQSKTYDIPKVLIPKFDPLLFYAENIEISANQSQNDTISIKDGSIKLDEVLVKGRIIEKEPNRTISLYGKPDFVVSGDVIRDSNVDNPLSTLQGRVPGVRVFQVNGIMKIDIRGSTSSSFGVIQDPLILVNGNPFPISTLNDVEAISRFNIERIEIVKRLVPIMGSRSSSGIINIITKDFAEIPERQIESTVLRINLKGFSSQLQFKPTKSNPIWITGVANNQTITVLLKRNNEPKIFKVELVGKLKNGDLIKCNKLIRF